MTAEMSDRSVDVKTGVILVVIGLALCATVIGAVVGVPILVIGLFVLFPDRMGRGADAIYSLRSKI